MNKIIAIIITVIIVAIVAMIVLLIYNYNPLYLIPIAIIFAFKPISNLVKFFKYIFK
jgi:hypothetical protein